MKIRYIEECEFNLIARWNRQLQEDEGAPIMSVEHIEARLRNWLQGPYACIIFSMDSDVGYAIYRISDDEAEGRGVYLRQFFIARTFRRKGYGRIAFNLITDGLFRGQRIVVEALESNPGGIAFWQSVGMLPYCRKFEYCNIT